MLGIMRALAVVAMMATAFAVPTTYAEQCGSQASGSASCSNSCCDDEFNLCALLRHCLCASTSYNCGCQSHSNGCGSESGGCSGGGGGVASVVSRSLFDRMLLHRNDVACPAKGFYTYDAFVAAASASAFRGFGTTGDADTRRREVAAFLAQTSHETTGGGRWRAAAPDGAYSWGYCTKQENDTGGQLADYCDPDNPKYRCAAGKRYYGRGPFQIRWSYNYGVAGEAIGEDLLGDPDLVATDPVVSFKTAIWFWMTPREPVPSCHDVVTGRWKPSAADRAAGREPGYGAVPNIINGDLECSHGVDDRAADRIGFYQRYCDILGISYGDNLYCYDQKPFG